MNNSDKKLIRLLWIVIAVLVVGMLVGGFFLVQRANELTSTNEELSGNNASLRRQLQQAQQTPAPEPSPAFTPAATTTPTPAPAATATPKPTPTPKPTATPNL